MEPVARFVFIRVNSWLEVFPGIPLVVHPYREENPNGEEIIRIISAREADPRERRIYLEQAP